MFPSAKDFLLSALIIESIRETVVVLPFVPVTAITQGFKA